MNHQQVTHQEKQQAERLAVPIWLSNKPKEHCKSKPPLMNLLKL
ncbi:hypothetical protein S7335_1624 [Synechococcus sp. PCC 7335]|nr:hypothetical protein S7335_1624 [Synechococcus sp. PCC 7335]